MNIYKEFFGLDLLPCWACIVMPTVNCFIIIKGECGPLLCSEPVRIYLAYWTISNIPCQGKCNFVGFGLPEFVELLTAGTSAQRWG